METCVTSSNTEALSVYTFRVTDAETEVPIEGAECIISDSERMLLPFEGVGCITGADGVCSVEPLFPPNYYSVYKAGYVTAKGSVPGTTIEVALESTEVLYWVSVFAGANGSVTPSGTFQVKPNAKLTVTAYPDDGYVLKEWLLNGVSSGNTNPIGVFIDRDTYNITAIFKEAETPPPNGPPPPEWPVVKEIHLLDSFKLKAEAWDYVKRATRTLMNVDTGRLLGGRLDWVLTYVQGNELEADGHIFFNDVRYVSERLTWGKSRMGSVDLTGLIKNSNVIKIAIESLPPQWFEMAFDVWITLGFSEDPVVDPVTPDDLDWWWPWAIAGGSLALLTVGSVVLYQENKRREELMWRLVAGEY